MLTLALTLAALALVAARLRDPTGRSLLDQALSKLTALSPRQAALLAVALSLGFGFALLGVAEISLVVTLDMTLCMEAAIAIGWASSMVRVRWVAARAKAMVVRAARPPTRVARVRAANDNTSTAQRTTASDDEEPAAA